MNSDKEKIITLVAAEEEDKIYRNVLKWLNTFPDIPSDVLAGNPLTPINFDFLEDNKPGIAVYTIPGTYIVEKNIIGGYNAIYQFQVVYRIIPGNTAGPDKRLRAGELLNRIGDWASRSVSSLDLGFGIQPLEVEVYERASLLAPYANGDEDYQITMGLIYKVKVNP